MTTKFVGMKELRRKLATYTKASKKKGIRYIVLRKNIPVLEIRPIDEKEFLLEKLAADIAEARKDVQKGHIKTQEQIMKEFGLL